MSRSFQFTRYATGCSAVMVIWSGVFGVALAAVDKSKLPAVANRPVDFAKDIQPIFKSACYSCHGPEKQKSGYRLDAKSVALKGGDIGPAIVPGNSADSPLIHYVADLVPDLLMPSKGERLSATQIGLLRAWIDQGAKWPDGADPLLTKNTADHWAFKPMANPPVPKVKKTDWVKSPVDAFVLAKLEQKGLSPATAADKRTLLRRVTFDLTGLPPTPEEVSAFLVDKSPTAFKQVVERLLASTAYGERWARHWLDVVRYAESNGYERDGTKPSAWRYRDYVIDSLNRDKPFDRFLTEQLAGDELEGSNAETQIATTFLRLGTWDDEPADHLLDRYDQLDDVLGVTATTFLGQTLRCARCHDHKFEPFSQVDYYRVLALFEPLKRPQKAISLTHKNEFELPVGTAAELKVYADATAKADVEVAAVQRQIDELNPNLRAQLFSTKKTALSAEAIAAFQAEPAKRTEPQQELVRKFQEALNKEIREAAPSDQKEKLDGWQKQLVALNAARPKPTATAYIWYEDTPQAPPTRVLKRGVPTRPGEEVAPGVPAILVNQKMTPLQPLTKSTGRRFWLARWLTQPEHPLVARVIVNRVWQWHFGEGLVATENDFGVMGQKPSHPELLDWLARDFIASGWSLKHLHRQIVLSSVYQMSSAPNAKAGRRDPDERLLWRWKPRRQEAEAVRDAILLVSGQLNGQRGGPSVFPPLPPSVLAGQDKPGNGWGKSDERQVARRSIYIFVKRSLAVPELELLDTPDTAASCEQRMVSTTGPQALTFLNGEFTRKQAQHFATRLLREAGGEVRTQILRAFELALSRPPSAKELGEALQFLAAQQQQIQIESGGNKPENLEARHKALAAFCLVLLNTNEFFYLN